MAGRKQTAVSNEEIVAAMLSNGTISAAAAACGIAPRTIYDRMQDKDFKAEYEAAKNDIVREAVYNLNSQLSAAVDTIAEIMKDRENNPAVRLQAAQTILNNAGKLSDRLKDSEQAYNRMTMPEDKQMQKLFDLFDDAI